MERLSFCIIGPGRLGTALAVLLRGAGWPFLGACGRRLESAERACKLAGGGRAGIDAARLAGECELVMITTGDDALPGVCRSIAEGGGFNRGAVVAHCSGVLTSDTLEPARSAGAHTGSLHPIQSFASTQEAIRILPSSYCSIEGDCEALRVLSRMAQDLNLHSFEVPGDKKPLYHAGAVIASNLLVALQDIAQDIEREVGLSPQEASRAFLPLLRGTVENIDKLGTTGALTGPFARGDCETVRLHMKYLRRHCPDALPVYSALGRRALELGLRQGGVSEEAAESIRAILAPGAAAPDG